MPLFSRRKQVENKPVSAPNSPARLVQQQQTSNLANGALNASATHLSHFGKTKTQENHQHLFTRWEEDSSFLFVTPLRTKSRLTAMIDDVLHDQSARSYFIQYMEQRNVVPLIKFWLDAQSFRASAKSRIESLRNNVKKQQQQHHHVSTEPSHRSEFFRERIDNNIPVDIPSASGDNSRLSSDSSSPPSSAFGSSSTSSSFSSGPSGTESRNPNNVHATDVPTVNNDVNNTDVTKPPAVVNSATTTGAISHSRSASSDISICEKLKKSIADDAVKIFAKYVAKDASHPIGVTSEMRDEITAKICREDGDVDPECFVCAQTFVYNVMKKEHFGDYNLSEFHRRFQIEVLTSGKLELEDVLYNETALTYFMEFLEQENKRPLLEFWLTADNFRQHLISLEGKHDVGEVQEDAMVLYDKYFSLQAMCPLGFGDGVRFEVEQNICREDGPSPDCFEKPVKMVYHYLQKNYLKPFLTSQLYFTFLSELLNSARVAEFGGMGMKKRSGSDTSSEHSVSTQNTLLAMDSGKPGVLASRKSTNSSSSSNDVTDMRIHLDFHPDSLWKRNLAGKLSFGRVNSLGQFIPEFEPEPDKKKQTESVLSKAMKRLVNREDKVQEEMAWQVAAMIVNEVTSVTCGGPPTFSS